nr:amidase [Rhodococcus sp. 06-621-2]
MSLDNSLRDLSECVDAELARDAVRRNEFNAWTTIVEGAAIAVDPPAASPLRGVPFGVKDVIDVAGVPTAAGSKFPATNAAKDAPVVASLKRAGAVVVGKNATHEFAYGPTGEIAAAGPTLNPTDKKRISGGSSSGSGAAVAAGDVAFSLGTDTGGSVRIPAALCGVVGFRPTQDRLSVEGVLPVSPTLDTVGVIAASTDVLRAVWFGLAETETAYVALSQLSVGVVTGEPVDACSAEISNAFLASVASMENLGAATNHVDLDSMNAALTVYRAIHGPEASAFHRARLDESPELFQATTLGRLSDGAHVPGWQYVEALETRRRWISNIEGLFGRHDVLICPTTPLVAPELGTGATPFGPWASRSQALLSLTVPWSLLGVPSASVPMGRDGDGMPMGLQIIGRPDADELVIGVAAALQEQLFEISTGLPNQG